MDRAVVLSSIDDVNVVWEKCKAIFTLAVDEIIQLKDVRIKYRTEAQVNEDIRKLMHIRGKVLFILNKNKHNDELRKDYNKARNKVTRVIKKTKANYFHDKVEEHKDKPKLLWKQFKALVPAIEIKKKLALFMKLIMKNVSTQKKQRTI